MKRRTILKLVAAGVLPGADGLVQLANAQDAYSPEFLSRGQFELADALTEVIIPADDHSPGAQAAKVVRYVDVMLADSGKANQKTWRDGLKLVAKTTKKKFRKDFSDCDAEEQDAIVAEMAQNEGNPTNDLESFFAVVKRATLDGYYTSTVGIHQDLQYKGNTAVAEFAGCTHDHA